MPGATRCQGSSQQTCDARGMWGSNRACTIGCAADRCTGVAEMALGEAHSCALLTDRTVRCWGNSEEGQVGDGSIGRGARHLRPTQVHGLTTATQIAAGSDHTCARLADGTVRCWGHGGIGRIGDGAYESRPIPVMVPNLTRVVGLARAHTNSCAWLEDGTARCWGSNQYGQLGNATTTDSFTPAVVQNLTRVAALSTGERSVCALREDKTVWCWGEGHSGELGDGRSGPGSQAHVPEPISTLGDVEQIAMAAYSGCARFVTGPVRCWGSNLFGQVGDGSNVARLVPTPVRGLASDSRLAPGAVHMCALDRAGAAFCWGRGYSGELGGGVAQSRSAAVASMNRSGAVGLAAGVDHTCAWYADATVQCWGSNEFGQLGDGSFGGGRSLPVDVRW